MKAAVLPLLLTFAPVLHGQVANPAPKPSPAWDVEKFFASNVVIGGNANYYSTIR